MVKWLRACGGIVLAASASACASSVTATNGGAGGDDGSTSDTGVTTGAGGASSTSSTSTTGSTASSTTGGGCSSDAECDDQDACTTDSCTAGACQHAPVAIDDGNACTTDACDPASGVSHTPVPVDDANVCTTDACDPVNGVSHAPIPVDDGNVCTTDSCDPVNGVSHAPIACDDGDPCTVDSCDPVGGCAHAPLCAANETCTQGVCTPIVGGSPKVFATSANGTAGFYEYDVKGNTWTTRPSPPSVTYAQLTTDGSNVYLAGSDNKIYEYTPATQTWSYVQAGPGGDISSPIALFKYANGTFYYSNDGNTTLLWSANGGAWSTVNLPASSSSAGTYDAASGNIYIRNYGNMGVMVFSTNTKTVTQSWPNATSVWENSRTGSYYNGYFYERDNASALMKMSMANGALTTTGVTPSEGHTSSDVNPATGDIYIGPYTTGLTFQVFNANTSTLKTLTSLPVAITNHSTIVYVAGGQKYWASGVLQNVAPATLTGWQLCYQGTYEKDMGALMSTVLQQCSKSSLLLACRKVGAANLQLAAMGARADVLFDCGTSNSCSHQANGVGWYWSNGWSWGFANAGDAVSRNECDTNAGPLRLCWHTLNQNVGGYRCGDTTGLNGDATWERDIYQAD